MFMARLFVCHNMLSDTEFTTHVLGYIKIYKSMLRSNSIRNTNIIDWIQMLNTLIHDGLNVLD